MKDLLRFLRFASRFQKSLEAIPRAQHLTFVEGLLKNRDKNLLELIRHAVYSHPKSPYLRLFQWAGIELGDIDTLLSREGVEGTLETLMKAGVYIRLDEVRGEIPIRRGSLEFEVDTEDFGNPVASRDFEVVSGGSRSLGRRTVVDLEAVKLDSSVSQVQLDEVDLTNAVYGLWRPVPPGVAGFKNVLVLSQTGRRPDFWFSQVDPRFKIERLKYWVFLIYTRAVSRLAGMPIPRPQFVPVEEAASIASHLAMLNSRGHEVYLDTNVSCGVRVCRAALEKDWDISHTFFRLGSEPLTPGKAKVLDATGCRYTCHYASAETGFIGIGCLDARQTDEVHLNTAKFGFVQRPHALPSGETIPILLLTTLSLNAGRIMLNLETDDFGVLETRECNCALGKIGLNRHFHTIRSYEKLSSEGMQFLGTRLTELLDEVLPARFGGSPTDYQLLETEVDSIPVVRLLVSPRLGELNENQILGTSLDFLGREAPQKMMVEIWKQAGTLQVVREEPRTTPASKIMSLYQESKRGGSR